ADRADEWRKLNRQSNSAQNGAHDARARVMTILGYAIDSIRGKLSALRELGFSDPAKIITSLPAILGYAPERLHLAPGIIANLRDRADAQLGRPDFQTTRPDRGGC